MEHLRYIEFNNNPLKMSSGDLFLILDTETTGIPERERNFKFSHYSNLPKYAKARVIQLAYAVFKYLSDDHIKYVHHKSFLIKDPSFTNEAEYVNHISDQTRDEDGLPMMSILKEFTDDLKTVKCVVCHGCSFDFNVLLSEGVRIGYVKFVDMFLEKPAVCTKRGDGAGYSGDKRVIKIGLEKIRNLNPNNAPLSERVQVDFAKYPFLKDIQAHDALYDVFLTLQLLLDKLKIIADTKSISNCHHK
jgi:DNA polymerase III epsilon subunit-like protein